MELAESIETINRQLSDNFGVDTVTGRPIWRVSWADDQFENRFDEYTDYSPEGVYLRTVKEVRNVPKYPWLKGLYVLERLVLVPEVNQVQLPTVKQSYEPMFPFMTNKFQYAPPTILACRFIIDTIYAQIGKKQPVTKDKYDGLNKKEYYEAKDAEIKKLVSELFPNETDTGDALAHKEAVIVPRNYEKEH